MHTFGKHEHKVAWINEEHDRRKHLNSWWYEHKTNKTLTNQTVNCNKKPKSWRISCFLNLPHVACTRSLCLNWRRHQLRCHVRANCCHSELQDSSETAFTGTGWMSATCRRSTASFQGFPRICPNLLDLWNGVCMCYFVVRTNNENDNHSTF